MKLYSNWMVPTNVDAALQILGDPSFNPENIVLVNPTTPIAPPVASASPDAGTATITDRLSEIRPDSGRCENAICPPVEHRTAPDWLVTIDKKPVEILRCNYIMRGVLVPPGSHTVEFRYKPSLKTLFVTLSAIGCGIAVGGYLMATRAPISALNEETDSTIAARC